MDRLNVGVSGPGAHILTDKPCKVYGWGMGCVFGTGQFELLDGSDIFAKSETFSTSIKSFERLPGVICKNGITLNVVSGAVTGVIQVELL